MFACDAPGPSGDSLRRPSVGDWGAPSETDTLGRRGRRPPGGPSGASSWRATPVEVDSVMPGDELVGQAKYRTTHAVSIDAPAERVWPWLIQMGQGRGGMYSYDWLENMLGLHMYSADRIIPRCSSSSSATSSAWCLRARSRHYASPCAPRAATCVGAGARYLAFDCVRGRPAVPLLDVPVVPTGAATTTSAGPFRNMTSSQLRWAGMAYKYALKPVHFVMERKMMLGIKRRAEQAA